MSIVFYPNKTGLIFAGCVLVGVFCGGMIVERKAMFELLNDNKYLTIEKFIEKYN